MEQLLVDQQIQNGELTVDNGESRLLFVRFESCADLDLKIHVKKDAKLVLAYADFGHGTSKTNIDVFLEEEGASCSVHGAVLAGQTDKKNIAANCFHLAPHTEGLVENYGITEGNSHLEFAGKSDIRKGSFESKTRQSAKIIVFDPGCVAHCSPILCIDENDVQASHAAIVGKLNEEHLFYLLSRGLSLKEARRLITLGYLKPIETYFDGEIKDKIDAAIEGGI